MPDNNTQQGNQQAVGQPQQPSEQVQQQQAPQQVQQQQQAKPQQEGEKKQQPQQQKQQTIKNLKKVPVDSSNLDWVAYDPDTKQLFIQFRSGGLYRYDKVPKDIYNGLMSAGSLGRFHNIKIKWKYPYTRLN